MLLESWKQHVSHSLQKVGYPAKFIKENCPSFIFISVPFCQNRIWNVQANSSIACWYTYQFEFLKFLKLNTSFEIEILHS